MKIFIATVVFLVVYTAFVLKVHIAVLNYSDIIVATTFFFTLFSGFFITRQNDRYSDIVEMISERDGLFSFLYRVFGMVPRIQNEMREIIRAHYQMILKSNDWAYNEFHPSTTVTKLTAAMSSVTDEEGDKIKNNNLFDGIWGAIQELQQNRKKIIAAKHERLTVFQWVLVYMLGLLLVISFNFIPVYTTLIISLKVVFGLAVMFVIVLLHQLDSLSLFGKNFGKKTAQDIFNILDEKDASAMYKK